MEYVNNSWNFGLMASVPIELSLMLQNGLYLGGQTYGLQDGNITWGQPLPFGESNGVNSLDTIANLLLAASPNRLFLNLRV